VGVFDVMGQLIVSDNSSLVLVTVPEEIKASGSTRVLPVMGLASFSFEFTPFSTSTFNITFSSSSMVDYVFEYQFRDCQSGEVRSQRGCFPCAKNSYSLEPSNEACQICPDHVQCSGRMDLVLDPDYWRANTTTDVIYRCLVQESCLGGFASVCASGYKGTMCNSCAEGFYRYGNWQCRDCEMEVPEAARGVLIAILVIVNAAVPAQLFLEEEGIGYRCALLIRIFVNYAQTIMYVTLLHAHWGFSSLVHNEILRVVGSFGGLLIYGGCKFNDLGVSAHFFQAIALAMYPVLLLVTCCVFWGLFLRCQKETLGVIMSAWCVALYCYLPVLSLVVVSLYECQEVAGETWLVVDMQEKCWSGQHLYFAQALAAPLLVILVLGHCFAYLCLIKPPATTVCRNFHKYLTA